MMPRLLLLCLVLGAALYVYLEYFTPTKRAVRLRLSEADEKSQEAIDRRLKPLDQLFAKGRKGAKAFAEDALSWNSKWHLVKGIMGGDSHRAYLSEAFARHVFSPDELRAAMESSVSGYLDDIEGYESEMLVKLRVDLADPERPLQSLPPHLRGNEEFRKAYRKLSDVVMSELRMDMTVTVGRELGMLVATDVATQTALQAARAAATEMGISGGVLSTGAVSTVATLGVGLVIGFIIDYMLDQIFKMAGYDPAAKIEALVRESIDKMQDAMIRDAGYFSFHKKGTLRERMEQLHEARSKLRRETINRFINDGGNK
jgi:hypothetical protein